MAHSDAAISPSIEVNETTDGVRYVLHTSNNERSNLSVILALVVRVPVVAAVLAVWFVWQHFRQVSLLLVGLSALFVLQMIYISRMPWNLLRRRLWQQLIDRFGHGEIEIRGDRLLLGSRVGVFWSGSRKPIGECRRVIVYTYRPEMQAPTETAGTTHPEIERSVLAIETSEAKPWLLVDGFTRPQTIALAEHIQRRLSIAGGQLTPPLEFPQPVHLETEQDVLYPPLDANFYQRRRPLWLAVHVAGAVGLGALTAIAMQTGAWQSSTTKVTFIFGWLLEMLLLGTTVSLSSRVNTLCAKDQGD